MIPGLASKERAKLLSKSRKLFAAKSWVIGNVRDLEIDFTVSRGHLSAFVVCIDIAVLNRISAADLLSGIDSMGRFYRSSRNKLTLFVTNGQIYGIDFGRVYGEERAVIVEFNDLEGISDIDTERFNSHLEYDPRQLAVIKSSTKACVDIGERCSKNGSLDEAIWWYEAATKAAKGFSFGYPRLISALTDQGRFDDAMAVAERALDLSRKNPQLLRACEKIEIRRGDVVAAQKWRQAIEDSKKKTSIKDRLDSIAASTRSEPTTKSSSKSANLLGKIRRFFG